MAKFPLLLYVFVLLVNHISYGQQDVQYTQYIYNTVSFNPAYAGSREAISGILLHRSQWLGVNGAPSTQTLNVHTPVGRNIGLGLSVINDEIGNATIRQTQVAIPFSYTLYLENEHKLSFGLKVGGQLLDVDPSKLIGFESITDELVNIDRRFSPNIGAGIYYHTPRFYTGFSIPNILRTEHFANESSTVARDRMNLYLTAGYVFNVSETVKFKPATLFRMVRGAPLQVDLSANFLFNEKFTLGTAYRWNAAFSGLIGFYLSPSTLIGLAYDREVTALGDTQFNSGSFELLLRVELFSAINAISPRFF